MEDALVWGWQQWALQDKAKILIISWKQLFWFDRTHLNIKVDNLLLNMHAASFVFQMFMSS